MVTLLVTGNAPKASSIAQLGLGKKADDVEPLNIIGNGRAGGELGHDAEAGDADSQKALSKRGEGYRQAAQTLAMSGARAAFACCDRAQRPP